MKALPSNLKKYKETPRFTESTTPKGLLNSHNTKPGVWGKIILEKGELEYTILEPKKEVHLLAPNKPGVVEPEIHHQVAPRGEVTFYVEFYK